MYQALCDAVTTAAVSHQSIQVNPVIGAGLVLQCVRVVAPAAHASAHSQATLRSSEAVGNGGVPLNADIRLVLLSIPEQEVRAFVSKTWADDNASLYPECADDSKQR